MSCACVPQPALELVKAVRLYGTSLERYGSSPFIYPVYGLGGLPESFSRCVKVLQPPIGSISFPFLVAAACVPCMAVFSC